MLLFSHTFAHHMVPALVAAIAGLLVLESQPEPPDLLTVCSSTAPVPTKDDYPALIRELQIYFASLPLIPAERACTESLPKKILDRTKDTVFSSDMLEEYQEASGISYVAWSLAEVAARAGREPASPADSRVRLRDALKNSLGGDGPRQAAILDQFDFALAYIGSSYGLVPDQHIVDAYMRLSRNNDDRFRRSGGASTYERHNFSMDVEGRHPLVDPAMRWGEFIWLTNLFERSRSNRRLLFTLYTGLQYTSPPVFRRVMVQQMLAGFFLPPTASTDLDEARGTATPTFTVQLTGSLRPGGRNDQSFDVSFPGTFPEFRRTANWIDEKYGEVWSQSMINVRAPQSEVLNGHVQQTIVDSLVVGGYDPPWPSGGVPLRDKRDHSSFIDFTIATRVQISACDTQDLGCEPRARVNVETTADDPANGATNTVAATQQRPSSSSPTRIAGNSDALGYTFEIDRSLGPVTVETKLTRSGQHKGASEHGWVRQFAQIHANLGTTNIEYEQRRVKPIVHEWFLDAKDERTPDEFALLGRSLALIPYRGTDVDSPESPTFDRYLRLALANMILEHDGDRMPAVDRQSIEKSMRRLAAEARVHTPMVRQRIADLRAFANALDTAELDVAVASLITDKAAPAKALAEVFRQFQTWQRTLAPEESEAIATFAQQTVAAGPASDAIVALSELKGRLTRTRQSLREELVDLVVELARLEADCEGLRAELSTVLGQAVTLPGAFACR